jgi:lysophospholipase L1-like esterase
MGLHSIPQFSRGTGLQVLRTNADATGTEWATLGEALIDNAEARVAINAAGITSAIVKGRLVTFFKGLHDLGIAANFVDGACYRPGFQSSVASLVSLRGYASTVGSAPVLTDGGLKFDGVDDYVQHSIQRVDGSSRTIIWFGSGNFTDGASAAYVPISVVNSTNSNNGYHRLHISSVHGGFRGESYDGFTFGVTAVDATVTQNSPESHMLVTRDGNAGTTTTLTANVNDTKLVSSTSVAVITNALDRVIISALQGTTSINGWFKSTTSAWLVFNTALTDTQLADLRALAERTISPVMKIVVEGDSLSESGNWTNYAISTNNLWGGIRSLTNVAGSGATVTAMLASYASEVAPLAPSAGEEKWATILGGTNDVVSASGATIFSRLSQWWALARADGFKVVAFTIPRSGGGYNSVIDAANALIRTAGDEYDLLVDTDRFFKRLVGSDTYYTNLTYFNADQVHLVNAGRSALGAEVSRLLRMPWVVT